MSNGRYGGNSDVGRNVSKSDGAAMPTLDSPYKRDAQMAGGAGLAATGGYQFVRAHKLPKTYAAKVKHFDDAIAASKQTLKKPGVKGFRNKFRARAHAVQSMRADSASRRIWANALANAPAHQSRLRSMGTGMAVGGVGLAALAAHSRRKQQEMGPM